MNKKRQLLCEWHVDDKWRLNYCCLWHQDSIVQLYYVSSCIQKKVYRVSGIPSWRCHGAFSLDIGLTTLATTFVVGLLVFCCMRVAVGLWSWVYILHFLDTTCHDKLIHKRINLGKEEFFCTVEKWGFGASPWSCVATSWFKRIVEVWPFSVSVGILAVKRLERLLGVN